MNYEKEFFRYTLFYFNIQIKKNIFQCFSFQSFFFFFYLVFISLNFYFQIKELADS